MKEITFINQHIDRWKKLEKSIASSKSQNPEELATLYIQLTDDLSYARTYFPGSDIAQYLNRIALNLHQQIYKNKKESKNRFRSFWVKELPLAMYESRRPLLYSFLVFSLAVIIGWVSQKHDSTFARLIMGNGYVNMTLDNIDRGDPMAVYKSMNETTMFLGITMNNIKVAFMAFLFGLFSAIGTGAALFQNGIMLGTFQAFFSDFNLFWESARTIWIHGTLEISAVIIAGAAGFVLGNSLLFPGTYPRSYSFRMGIKRGLKIALGLVPVFITAGFLEGFVTRHTNMPLIISLLIIIGSFLFIVWYFIFYPIKVFHLQSLNNAERENKF